MTDATAPEQSDAEGWGDATPAPTVTYPQHPDNPHNHRFTLSYDPTKPPFMVVRANTAADLQAALDELESSGTNAAIGATWSAYKAALALGAGLGQTTPVNGAPAPAQAPQQGFQPQQGQFAPGTGPAFNPQMPSPGMPGQAPAAWQNAGAPQQQFAPQGVRLPPGWYKLNVPFPQKGAFDGIVAQYGIRKGDPNGGGQVSFQKAVKSWFCAPDVVQAFAQFSPVPA